MENLTGFIQKYWIRQEAWGTWGMNFALLGLLLSFLSIFGYVYSSIRYKGRRLFLMTVLVIASFWHAQIYMLIYSGFIRSVPELFNKGIGIYYLIAPCAYFFVYFSLFPNNKWPRYVWIHLLPFALGLIDAIPYIMVSLEEKKAFLALVVENMHLGIVHRYGYINQEWHYITKFILAFFYLIAQWRLIYLYNIELSPISTANRRNIKIFSIIYSGQLLFQGGMVLKLLFNSKQTNYLMQDLDQLTIISFFYLLLSCWFIHNLFRSIILKNEMI